MTDTLLLPIAEAPAAVEVPARDTRRAVRFLLRRPGLVLSGAVMVLVVLAAFWPGLLTSRDPFAGIPAENFRAPGAAHWSGTDELGRDVATNRIDAGTVHFGQHELTALSEKELREVRGTRIGLVPQDPTVSPPSPAGATRPTSKESDHD